MTNLDIIKYLAYEKPSRLAELLDDIYCTAWNHGSYAAVSKNPFSENEIDDFNEWIRQEANTNFFYDHELKEWYKAINPVYLIDFGEGKIECKDGKLSMQSGDCNIVIDQAIGEIKLLENIIKTDKYSDDLYNGFRKEVCADCPSTECIQSKMDIVECPAFDNYLSVI